ncbi:MAG: GIY-YIG nuclease family protein [Archaeoglobus sp.]|nr:GIY-YIG nuclease family protein [Archaeoglobus sp.]
MKIKNARKGAYVLILENQGSKLIRIGKRKLYFEKGYYIYCGSAMNNLEKRIERHFSKEKKLRWNIDYLSVKIRPITAFGIISEEKIECWLSKELSKIFDEFDEFGAADCSCKTHLFYSQSNPLKRIEQFLNERSLNYFRV